jgi:hypothetical protein
VIAVIAVIAVTEATDAIEVDLVATRGVVIAAALVDLPPGLAAVVSEELHLAWADPPPVSAAAVLADLREALAVVASVDLREALAVVLEARPVASAAVTAKAGLAR